jgi:hypothetical protein
MQPPGAGWQSAVMTSWATDWNGSPESFCDIAPCPRNCSPSKVRHEICHTGVCQQRSHGRLAQGGIIAAAPPGTMKPALRDWNRMSDSNSSQTVCPHHQRSPALALSPLAVPNAPHEGEAMLSRMSRSIYWGRAATREELRRRHRRLGRQGPIRETPRSSAASAQLGEFVSKQKSVPCPL